MFAFLDILICTMGALILMLMVVTTRQLRKESLAQVLAELKSAPESARSTGTDAAEARSESERRIIPAKPESIPQVAPFDSETKEKARIERNAAITQREREIADLIDDWIAKTRQLARERDERATSLEASRRIQASIAQQITGLKSEVENLEGKLRVVNRELSTQSENDGTLDERRKIEEQIADLKKQLKAAQAAASRNQNRVAIVPFDPKSGTSRRPILIECTAEGLRFIPENVVIQPNDLAGFTPRVNPLLAGSVALVNHWKAWNLNQPESASEPEPYVLLLVRPSGTVAYYVAVKMLATLQQAHGYELIEEDTQFQYPTVDSDAKAACERAVAQMLAERDQIKSFAGGGGLAAFSRGAARESAFRKPGSSTLGVHSKANRFEVTDITDEGEEDVGVRSWERIEKFSGRKSQRKSETNAETASGRTNASRTTTSKSAGSGETDAVDDSVASNRVENRSPSARVEKADPVSFRNRVSDNTGSGSDSTSAGDRREAESDSGANAGIERIDGEEGSSQSPDSEGQSPTEKPLVDIGLGSTGSSPIRVEDRRSGHKPKPKENKSFEPEQLLRKHWGLSGPDAAIGIEREVLIQVEPSRIVVGRQHAIRSSQDEASTETFERLASALDLQAREWGQPPHGFYWKPSLRFDVSNDGTLNYERMRGLAERAGLSTSRNRGSDSQGPSGQVTAPQTSNRISRGAKR